MSGPACAKCGQLMWKTWTGWRCKRCGHEFCQPPGRRLSAAEQRGGRRLSPGENRPLSPDERHGGVPLSARERQQLRANKAQRR